MKKTYTKKQIQEAIAYWNRQLERLDETVSMLTIQKIQQQLLKGGEWNLVVTHNDGRVTERVATCDIPPELRAEFKDCLLNSERLWYYVPAKSKICCVSRCNVKKLQLLPVGKSAIQTVAVTDDMAEAWFEQLKTCRQFIEITGKNGKKNTVEASLEGISQQECDRLHDDIANGKLWFKPVQSWKFNQDLMYVNFRADDIASITLHPIPYRVLVGDKTSRVPKVVKKTKDLQTAIDELTRLAELDMAPVRAKGLNREQLNINGIDSRYNGYSCDIWLDQTTEAPSLLYENISANGKENTDMKKQYTKKQIMESIKYWQKQLKAGNYKKLDEDAQSEYDENGRDEYGFTKEETDVFLFDIVDQTGSIRNGNYDHYAVCTDGTIPEHEVKRRLDEMAKAWSGNALRNAKREAKKRHEQLKPYDMPYLAFKVANVKHMTKQQFIEDGSLGEIRFFSIDD